MLALADHTRSRLVCLLFLVSTGLGGCLRTPMPPEVMPKAAPKFLSGAYQLTFEGQSSQEAYFSRDSRNLIFQSKRATENASDQIYTLDLQNGLTRRVSPSRGEAISGFFHPGGRLALFSSTFPEAHGAPLLPTPQNPHIENATPPLSSDYDRRYDIFSVSLEQDSQALPKRLTNSTGYDGEASWSPNGRKIVFASNRHVFESENSMATDPHSQSSEKSVDLYIMDSSGRNVRRLTESPGYDGRPFFSPGGDRIIWSRSSPDELGSQIRTMNVDGSNVIQVTHPDAVSQAPFYHPSGEYIIFSAVGLSHENFELYIVDTLGDQPPVRVTHSSEFNGLPAFSPSGEELVWTRALAEKSPPQLFRAEWNDALARRLLNLPARSGPSAIRALPLPLDLDPKIDAKDLRKHVESLASPVTEGRLTGTAGERIATSYVARTFRKLGLEPAGDNGSYFQSFGFTAGVSLGLDNQLELFISDSSIGLPHQVDTDWRPFAFSREGIVEPTQVVYAGYGIKAPGNSDQRAIDDYDGLDVTGRWVLIFRYMPEDLSPASRQHLHRFSSLRHKAMIARDQGAKGLLVMSGPASRVREELAPLKFDVSLAGSSITTISITDELAQKILTPSGRNLKALQKQADSDSAELGFLLPDVTLSATVELERQRKTGRNVIGRLQVGPSPSRDFVILGAHLDHLGAGGGSGSLAKENAKEKIHPGADDNASGVAALLEIAQEQSQLLANGNLTAERDLVFAAWSGEELGLLGSNFWVDHAMNPHLAQSKLSDLSIAYLNFDMVGRMDGNVSIFGVGSSPIWPREIETANVNIGLPIVARQESTLPTDTTSFYSREVPVLAAFTGAHTDYHTPTDTPEKLNYEGLEKIAMLMSKISISLATQSLPPRFQPGESTQRGPVRAHLRAYLGTVPDYAKSEVMGVSLSGVTRDGPAERAGLQSGDIIVELAGRKIENIYDYTFAIEALKIDEPISLSVEREGQIKEFTVVPTSRD